MESSRATVVQTRGKCTGLGREQGRQEEEAAPACGAQRAARGRPVAPVGLRAHRSPLEGSSAPSMVPLTQKSYFKDLIPRTQLSQDRKNKEPPSFGEHLLCARPVLSMESHHIQSLQPPEAGAPERSILQMRMLRPSRACADPTVPQGRASADTGEAGSPQGLEHRSWFLGQCFSWGSDASSQNRSYGHDSHQQSTPAEVDRK